jgi:hypothetical protein
MHWRLPALLLVWLAAALFSGACAPNPKYVAASTGRPGEIKFLYFQRGDHGLIQCVRGEDGALSRCRKLELDLVGE